MLSDQQRELLAQLAGAMIPAQGDFPSAADSHIMLSVIEKLSIHDDVMTRGIHALENLTNNKFKSPCSELSVAELADLIASLRSQEAVFVQLLEINIITCYYQNDKVLQALGVAATPYPNGYNIAATDWSILDPVRARKPFYKKVGKETSNANNNE